MDEELAIQIIQRYRHDVLNHLQLVSGYLTIQKPEKAEEKVNEWIQMIEDERKLTNLDTPKFTLWIFQFSDLYKNFSLTYDIQLENKSYHVYDQFLYRYSCTVMDLMNDMIHPSEVYPIMLQLKETTDALHMIMNVEGEFVKTKEDILNTFAIDEEKMSCRIKCDNHSYEVDVAIFK